MGSKWQWCLSLAATQTLAPRNLLKLCPTFLKKQRHSWKCCLSKKWAAEEAPPSLSAFALMSKLRTGMGKAPYTMQLWMKMSNWFGTWFVQGQTPRPWMRVATRLWIGHGKQTQKPCSWMAAGKELAGPRSASWICRAFVAIQLAGLCWQFKTETQTKILPPGVDYEDALGGPCSAALAAIARTFHVPSYQSWATQPHLSSIQTLPKASAASAISAIKLTGPSEAVLYFAMAPPNYTSDGELVFPTFVIFFSIFGLVFFCALSSVGAS